MTVSKFEGKNKNHSSSSLLQWNIENRRKKGLEDDGEQEGGGSKAVPSVNDKSGSGLTTRPIEALTSSHISDRYFSKPVKSAGNSHKVAETDGFTRSNLTWTEYKKREYGTAAPFGTDLNQSQSQSSPGKTNGSGGSSGNSNNAAGAAASKTAAAATSSPSKPANTVKSLAEVMKSRQ